MLPFIISVACLNGAFVDTTCFAEAWLRAGSAESPRGAIAFYGSSTGQSWVPPCVGQAAAVNLLTQDRMNTVGGILFNGACEMIAEYEPDGYGADMFQTWHIFGDASVQVRTDTPQPLSVSHPHSYQLGPGSFTVTTGLPDAMVCLWKKNEGYHQTKFTDATEEVTFNTSFSSTGPLWMTVTERNHIPYEALIISGSLTQSQTWPANVFVCGDVTVPSGITLTIEPGTQVRFTAGADYQGSGADPNLCEFIVEGTLNATGDPGAITFTSASQTPKPGDWYGIRVLNGGSADIQYATIEYSDCGVSFDSAQTGNIISCTIKDYSVCGIRGYATDNLHICGSTISMPVLQCDDPRGGGDTTATTGIYIEDASAQIVDNQIGGGYYGIYGVGLDSTTVIKGSSNLEQVLEGNVVGLAFYSGSRPIVSDNKINEYRDIGVACYESCPLLGNSLIPGTGHNSIIPGSCSPQYAVYCEGVTDTIKAEMNRWSGSPPNPSWFYGPVDYEPWLTSVGVEPPPRPPLPDHFSLSQNYPNPFNPSTIIRYQLPPISGQRSAVSLKIYNILGQVVRTLVEEEQAPGYYSVEWDGRDSSGRDLASGVYIYRIQAEDFTQSRRMILLK